MAVFGHSGSQAPQLMHSEVIMVAMTGRRIPLPGFALKRGHMLSDHAGRGQPVALGTHEIWVATAKAVLTSGRSPLVADAAPSGPGPGQEEVPPRHVGS